MEADLAAPSLTRITPTAIYNNEIGMNVFRVITLTAVGDIPAGTAVRVATAMYNGSTWMYTIATRDEHFGTATQSQLAYLPNGGAGEPTATLSNIATATVPVMSLPTEPHHHRMSSSRWPMCCGCHDPHQPLCQAQLIKGGRHLEPRPVGTGRCGQ